LANPRVNSCRLAVRAARNIRESADAIVRHLEDAQAAHTGGDMEEADKHEDHARQNVVALLARLGRLEKVLP